jgi:hypothetical protein
MFLDKTQNDVLEVDNRERHWCSRSNEDTCVLVQNFRGGLLRFQKVRY